MAGFKVFTAGLLCKLSEQFFPSRFLAAITGGYGVLQGSGVGRAGHTRKNGKNVPINAEKTKMILTDKKYNLN